jgi:hypothetical protein
MLEIRKDLGIVKPEMDYTSIYKIKFVFTEGKYNTYHTQNLISWDTESSNGFKIPGSIKVIGLDQKKYDRGFVKSHGVPIDKIDHSDEDIKYMTLIDSCEPVGVMYGWTCAIEDGFGGIIGFGGRGWETFKEFVTVLTTEIRRQAFFGFDSIDRDMENEEALKSKINVDLSYFVHNLGHDWHFLLNLFRDNFVNKEHTAVFARKKRKPMKGVMRYNKCNICFKDTLVLSQKSLKKWAEDCPNCPLEKLDDFDYLTIKTPDDELTDLEWHYMMNDVLILVYCMEYERKIYKTLENIPITQTGKVRRKLVERVCVPNPEWAKRCYDITTGYTPEEYRIRVALYQGGYVHGNMLHIGHVGENLRCFDFASSYPSALMGKYPVFGYEKCDVSEFCKLEKQDVEDPEYRWFAKVRVKNVASKLSMCYWSYSKCVDVKEDMSVAVDNGRIMEADEMTIWVTDLDWYTFKKAYSFDDDFEVLWLEKGKADYVPKEMIEVILEYYERKTKLKYDKERESEQIESKQFINGIYGVFVYKLISDQVFFDGDWYKRKLDEEGDRMFYELMMDVSEEKSFGFFDLGLVCSAIARKRLWDFICEFDDRVWYCDTDSIKGEFTDDDVAWIECYNKKIEERENKLADHYGIDREKFAPVNSKGKHKRLGIMEEEPTAIRFKTLGCKRYLAEVFDKEKGKNVIKCTVAGLPKKSGAKKFKTFDDFTDGAIFTSEESDKVCCFYNEHQGELVWTGRDGGQYVSHDDYGICLKPITFDMSLGDDFIKFLRVLYNEKLAVEDETEVKIPDFLMLN